MKLFNQGTGMIPAFVRVSLRLLFLCAFALPGCAPSGPEADLLQADEPARVRTLALADCPPVVKKIIFKEVPEDVEGGALRGEALIKEVDMDQDGTGEYVIVLKNPNGVRHFLLVEEGGRVIARDYWFEMNKTGFRIVSLVKPGECEILFKRPGGGGNFETSYLSLFKKRGDALPEVFTAEAFRHEWSVNNPEKYVSTYFTAAGGEPPLKIVQYEGELAVDYMKQPKHRPDFQVKKNGLKRQKVFKWDEAKFKFTEK